MNSFFVLTLSDIIGLAFFSLIAIVWGIFAIKTSWKQWRCKHTGSIGKTQSCDAVCHQCGKNLGFIGAWKARRQP